MFNPKRHQNIDLRTEFSGRICNFNFVPVSMIPSLYGVLRASSSLDKARWLKLKIGVGQAVRANALSKPSALGIGLSSAHKKECVALCNGKYL